MAAWSAWADPLLNNRLFCCKARGKSLKLIQNDCISPAVAL
ncbi:hypothetical protein CYA_0344 [Synechococcus sp. JA-3-3Ab]|nr:hypothetical protein CYA_0344 [Synechococcus sp. JA-3-3Ab]